MRGSTHPTLAPKPGHNSQRHGRLLVVEGRSAHDALEPSSIMWGNNIRVNCVCPVRNNDMVVQHIAESLTQTPPVESFRRTATCCALDRG